MNEPARTPAPGFQDQLNALAEDMADGLGRQAAIDRLVELGLEEPDADDHEAAIREQLRALRRGTKAIIRDLENGLARPQALARFQELGLSREEAVQALEAYRERKDSALGESRNILEDINKGLGRAEAVARFRDLGLGGPAAEQFVGLRYDSTAHWHGEHVRLGCLSAGIGAVLLALVLVSGAGLSTAVLIPGAMVLHGTFFALHGWRKWLRSAPQKDVASPSDPSPFELARRAQGRDRAVARAVEAGVPAGEAVVLVHSCLDGMVKIYRGYVILGLLAAAWGALLVSDGFGLDLASLQKCAGAAALILWGAAGCARGLVGWRRFAKP